MTYGTVNYGLRFVSYALHMAEETIGARLERLLKIKGVDRAALAAYCGVQRMTVHQWIRDISEPRALNLALIAKFFGTDIPYIVFGDAREPPGGFPPVPPTAVEARLRRRRI